MKGLMMVHDEGHVTTRNYLKKLSLEFRVVKTPMPRVKATTLSRIKHPTPKADVSQLDQHEILRLHPNIGNRYGS